MSTKTRLFFSTHEISESGSSILPKMRAPVGQASRQAGIFPSLVRCRQKWHFSTTPCGLILFVSRPWFGLMSSGSI